MLMNRKNVIVLIILAVVLASIYLFQKDRSVPAKNDPLALSLNIPSKSDQWTMKGRRWNYTFDLTFPKDLGSINALPPEIQERVRQKIMFREKSIDALRQAAAETEQYLREHRFTQVPEYERNLSEVVVSVHPDDFDPAAQTLLHGPLLLSLPAYTVIHMFVPEQLAEPLEHYLRKTGLADRTHLYPVPVWSRTENGIAMSHVTTRWAQDLLEIVQDRKGMQYVLTPVTRYQIEDLSRPDNEYLSLMETPDRKIVKLPLFFRGGNILTGKAGSHIVLIGKDELTNNRNDYYNAIFSVPSDEAVVDLIKDITGAEKAIVLPNSTALFHLDMAVTFLDNGLAAIIDPLDREKLSADDRTVLEAVEKTLRLEGFRLLKIPTLTERISSFQSPVNIIPFVDRKTGKKTLMIPRFPDLNIRQGNEVVSLNKRIVEVYRAEGFNVISVKSGFYKKHGSLHCSLSSLD